MTAIDICELHVIHALEKEGWYVINKPHAIPLDTRVILADMSLEQSTNGKTNEPIVVEVKCFTHASNDLQEFYTAIGQYLVYRTGIAIHQDGLPLYLAISGEVYARLTLEPVFSAMFREFDVKLIIVDMDEERVIQWMH
jgi:hypothetical protein